MQKTARLIPVLFSVFLCQFVFAQTKRITGVVLDSASHAPLQNVSISIKNSTGGGFTDHDGKFRVGVEHNIRKLVFSITGYHPYTVTLTDSATQQFMIRLSKAYTALEDVFVSGKRKKYRNKDNPAVELIRKVIANKEKNGPGAYPYASYLQYEKIRGLVDKTYGKVTGVKPLKKFDFFFQNIDTTLAPGKRLTSIFLQEILTQNYYRRQPEKRKQIILGRKSVDFGEYIDTKGITSGLNRMYEDVNIYSNSVSAFTMEFISPIADLGPTFYQYYIRDTIEENGVQLVNLYFTPRNSEDLLFQGLLTITLDGNYAIRKASLGVTKHINLNYVRDFRINQDFEKGPGDRYYLATSDMIAHFSPFPRTPGIYAQRLVTVSHLTDTTLPDPVFKGAALDTMQYSINQADSFWEDERPVPLSGPEGRTYSNTDSLVRMKSYKRLMDYVTLFSVGYKSAGKFDIGPVGSFYSFNPVEGDKLRIGARSNTRLSTRYFGESYVAYGFRDQKWKYFLSGSYSVNNRSIYTYPFNYLQVSYLHDTKNPGQEGVFSQGNAFLSSFSRGYNGKLLYNDIFRVSNVREVGDHFSYILGAKYWKQIPAGDLTYVYEHTAGKFDTVRQLTSGELSASFRWAPHEQFVQNKVGRTNITNKYPILNFQYSRGINGLFGGQFDFNAFHLNVNKRWFLPPFGFSDISFDAEYLQGTLPFPLLIIHPTNQSYFYSDNAYNLMNSEEFVSDHYASLIIDHYFGGFFFNKIPLLKKLRLREVVAAKLLYGGLRNENNPKYNPNQMVFPLVNGAASTFPLDQGPYLEASAGVTNIFSFIRLDIVKRFTYLDHPDISKFGVRVSADFHF
ncbi:DUF5686 family protein [Flavitalea flava]